MILLNDHIRYEKVLSKKYEFYYEQLGTYMEKFFEEVKQLGAHPNGPFFYSLNNVPKDKIMRVDFFLPVKENIDTAGDMKFHSFYSVEQMVSTRVKADFERNTEMAYSALFQFLNKYNLKQMTPPYHIIDNVGEQPFVTIKVGYIGRIKDGYE